MILDTFAFLFQAKGSKEVKDDLDKIKKSEDELIGKNKDLSSSFGGLVDAVAPLVAAYAVLNRTLSFSEKNEEMFRFEQLTGMSAKSMEVLGIASRNFGGSMESAKNTMVSLQRGMMELRRTGGGSLANAAMMYGVNLGGKKGIAEPEELLRNVAVRMKGMSKSMQLDLGKMLGLDDATIMLLQKGVGELNKELEKAKRLSFTTPQDIEMSRELQMSIRESGLWLEGLGNIIWRLVAPAITWLSKNFNEASEYMMKHKEVVEGLVIALGMAFGAAMLTKIKAFFGLFIANPVVAALGLLSIALAAIYEDWKRFQEGGESAIGALLQKYPQIEDYAKKIQELFGQAKERVKEYWEVLKEGDYSKMWSMLKDDAKSAWEQVKTTSNKTWDEIIQYANDNWNIDITNLSWDDLKEKAKSTWELIKEEAEPIWESIKSTFIEKVKPAFEVLKEEADDFWSYFKDGGLGIDLGHTLGTAIKDLIGWFSKLNSEIGITKTILEAIKWVIETLANIGGAVWDNIKGIVRGFSGALQGKSKEQIKKDSEFADKNYSWDQIMLANENLPSMNEARRMMGMIDKKTPIITNANTISTAENSVNNASSRNVNANITNNFTINGNPTQQDAEDFAVAFNDQLLAASAGGI